MHSLPSPGIKIPTLTQRNLPSISHSRSTRTVYHVCAGELVADGFVDARFECCGIVSAHCLRENRALNKRRGKHTRIASPLSMFRRQTSIMALLRSVGVQVALCLLGECERVFGVLVGHVDCLWCVVNAEDDLWTVVEFGELCE